MLGEAPPLIEDVYSVVDAVVVGDLLISLLRHADRVRIACIAQLVNVIAPIRTDPGGAAWRQTTFHPFALTSRHGRGTVLRVEPRGPVRETASLGEVPLLHPTAVIDGDAATVTLFAPDRVTPRRLDDLKVRDGRVEAVLPPLSWSMIRLLAAP